MSKRERQEQDRAVLDRAWLEQLRWEWRLANVEHLKSALKPPVMMLDESIGRLGSWQSVGRLLTLSRAHIERDPWRDVLDTLRHEMAHQYAYEVLRATDETAHGPAFAHACAMLRVQPRGEGADRTERDADPDAARIIERVQKLLALGASDNRHEAEAAMAAAHRLLLAHNLALQAAAGDPNYKRRGVGPLAVTVSLRSKIVTSILTGYFFVEAVWINEYIPQRMRMGRRLELLGKPHDLELACYVHDFLHAAVERLFREARRRGEVAGDGRRDYEAGVLMGFRNKLRDERTVQAARGLVWVGDGDLDTFVRAEMGRLSRLPAAGPRMTSALDVGRRDGASLTLHRPVTASAKGGGLLSGPR